MKAKNGFWAGSLLRMKMETKIQTQSAHLSYKVSLNNTMILKNLRFTW